MSRVVIDPRMKGGTPCLDGRRLRAALIAERYWYLGAYLEAEILDDYEITRADVLACCFYVATYGSRTWKRRWKAWLDAAWANTGLTKDGTYRGWWSADWADVPLPPYRGQQEEADIDE